MHVVTMNAFWFVVKGTPMNEPDMAQRKRGKRRRQAPASDAAKPGSARGISALLLTQVFCARAESRRASSVAPMLSVVDETDDDWQAITALGSWAEFDAYFAEKYIDSKCFASGCTGGKGRKTTTRLGAFRDTINAAFHLDRQ